MTATELEKLCDHVWDIESASIPDRECLPTVVGQAPDGGIIIVKLPFANEAEKSAALYFAHKQLIEHDCVRYIFMHEAWAASYTKAALAAGGEPEVMPIEHPERKEILVAIGIERYSGETLGYAADITPAAGGKRDLGKRKAFCGEGRFYGLFGESQKTPQRTRH